jgi:hypothetical protein
MSTYANDVLASLPTLIPANGQFTVNSTELFEDVSGGVTSTTYSYPLINPAKIVGTASQPYIPVALPAYISTLYTNAYYANNNLQNTIADAASDDRHYPTSFAVQNYVQSQLLGTQLINGIAGNNIHIVTTSKTNTLITQTPSIANQYRYTYNSEVGDVALFWMNTEANAPRNGASKLVMFADQNNYFYDASGVSTSNIPFLYAGDGSYFVYMGQQFRFYQFVIVGDSISFVQAYKDGVWNWIVTSSMGLFSKTINLSGGVSLEQQVFDGREWPEPAPNVDY